MAIVKHGIQDDAVEILYDNADSGLSATNTKDAIDELEFISKQGRFCGSGWYTLTADFTVQGYKSGGPKLQDLNDGPFYGYDFSVGKQAFATFIMGNDYKPVGEVFLNIHWTAGDLFNPVYTVNAEENASGTPWRHMTTSTLSSINVSKVEPGSIIMMKITRVDASDGQNNSDDIFGLKVSLNYETDRHSTINRKPNFYGV